MTSKRSRLGGGFYLPAVLAVVTAIYLIDALRLGPPMRDGNMTASFFPILMAIIMLVALLCAMVQSLRANRTTDTVAQDEATDERGEGTDPATRRRYLGFSPGAIGVIVLTAAYLAAFDIIGYFVSTAIYVLMLCFLFGGVRRHLPSKIAATALITIAGYLLFEIVFQVRLPTLWSQ